MTSAGTTQLPGALMAAEIAEQPVALQRLLDDGTDALGEIAERLARRRPRFVCSPARQERPCRPVRQYLIEIVRR